jgi:hypothetical protein
MTSTHEALAQFIESEGHRVDLDDATRGPNAELLFRTRGYVFSVGIREGAPPHFHVATAYEIPPWARERAQNDTTLNDVAHDVGDVHFALAPNGKNFVVRLDVADATLQEFQRNFWPYVARVREAGIAALERILDRSESHAAANKFITSLIRGD